jgi:hypothetical protein
MPIFNDDNAQSFKSGSGFHFSGIDIKGLGASEYTLMGIACDTSSSVTDFAQEIEGCLISSIDSCQKSPRADNLLARLLTFASRVTEEHGFRPLMDCHLANYKGCIKPGGTTSLYDAATDLVDSLAAYGDQLSKQDYTANGIVIIITDGMDVGSTKTVKSVKEAVARAKKKESLESIRTILIGVNVTDPEVSRFLVAFKDDAGFDQYVEAKDASPKTLAKLAGFISKSVSSQSKSLGTGSASQPITF